MPRKQPKYIDADEKQYLLNEFWSMVLLLETRDEIKNFFRDLLSETEAIMLARRIHIARMLLQGESYDDIQKELKAGSGTIASVHRWLQGRNEGYAKLLPKLEKELVLQSKERQKKSAQAEFGSFEWMKRRYPMHYLLFNLLDLKDQPRTKRKYRSRA